MNRKTIYLIVGVLALLTFIGFMTETEPQSFFGYEVSIWIYRVVWLLLTISFLANYFKLRKAERR